MIFLDLDGVIAEFAYAACRVHGKPQSVTSWDFFKEWGISAEEFWKPINRLGDDFYPYYVNPTPWAQELAARVREIDDFRIVTDSSENMACIRGKQSWIECFFGPDAKVSYTRDKWLLAGPGRLLIDDSIKNCEAFAAHGGSALLFPRPWNAHYFVDPYESELTAFAKLEDWKNFRRLAGISQQDRLEAKTP